LVDNYIKSLKINFLYKKEMDYTVSSYVIYGWEVEIKKFERWLKENEYEISNDNKVVKMDNENGEIEEIKLGEDIEIIYSKKTDYEEARVAINIERKGLTLESFINVKRETIEKGRMNAEKWNEKKIGEPEIFGMECWYDNNL